MKHHVQSDEELGSLAGDNRAMHIHILTPITKHPSTFYYPNPRYLSKWDRIRTKKEI